MVWADICIFILSIVSLLLYYNYKSFHQQLSFYLYWMLVFIYVVNRCRQGILRRERIRRNINANKIRGSLNV